MISLTSPSVSISAVVTRAGHPAVAQHRHAVGDLEHLVEVVRDEQHARPARRDVADEVEQQRDLVLREEHGGLVEHQQGRRVVAAATAQALQGPDDGEQRPVDRADRLDTRARVEPQLVTPEDPSGLARRAAPTT